jgi:hypothetical protein
MPKVQTRQTQRESRVLKIPLPGLRRMLHLSWARPHKASSSTLEEWRYALEQIQYFHVRQRDHRMVLLHLVGCQAIHVVDAAVDLTLVLPSQERPDAYLTYLAELKASLAHPEGLFASRAMLDGDNVVDLTAWAASHPPPV